MSKAIEKASRKFYAELFPCIAWDQNNSPAKNLISAAFFLYAKAWGSYDYYNITAWEWPFDELARNGGFEGDEPWTILLRRAVEIARTP